MNPTLSRLYSAAEGSLKGRHHQARARAGRGMGHAEPPHVLAAALVRQAALCIAEQVQDRLQSHELTHMQWRALGLLRDAGISTPTETAADLGTDNPAVTRLLDRMEVKGLCRRARSSTDRRVVEVELGSKGAEILDHTGDLVHQVLAAQFAGATADELTVLQTVLTRLVRRCPIRRGVKS